MTTRPILMNGPMVRATLAGTKTQTRRIVKDQASISDIAGGGVEPTVWWPRKRDDLIDCPLGAPGDRLWVRETYGIGGARFVDPCLNYRADDGQLPIHKETNPIIGTEFSVIRWRGPGGTTDWPKLLSIKDGWIPSIHMPRWVSRITLEITSVRVERLQASRKRMRRPKGLSRGGSVPSSA